jgi:hypothetical protein
LVQEVIEANKEENKEELQEDKEVIEQQIAKINAHIDMEIQTINPLTNIIIDAEVIAPEYETIPFVRLRPQNFTKEEFENFADILTGGAPLYQKFPSDENIYWLSKEEIEMILPDLKMCAVNKDLKPHILSHLNDSIKRMEQGYKKAQSRADEEPYNGELSAVENNSSYNTITDLKAYLGRNQSAWINMNQSKNKTSSQMTFRNADYGSVYNTFEPYVGIDADKIDMTYDEAVAMAIETVRKLDGENTNFILTDSSIGYSIGFFRDLTKENSPQSYYFRFSKAYNGVPVKGVGLLYSNSFDINYREQIKPESLSILIDNNGFVNCIWINKSEYIETIAHDTPLLGFEQIQEIFENQLRYQFEWAPSGDTCPEGLGATITVKSIELNLMVTAEKDSVETYLVIPVWDLIGDITYSDKWIGQDGYDHEPPRNVSVLTINAIDGTIIDREQGY